MSEVLFTKSKPKRADVNGSPEQVFKMDDYAEYMIKVINSGNIAVKIYHPKVERDFQGDPTHIAGCPTNVQGEFSMVSIDIKMLDHFPIIDNKDDLTKSQCAKQPLPQDLRDGTPLEGQRNSNCS